MRFSDKPKRRPTINITSLIDVLFLALPLVDPQTKLFDAGDVTSRLPVNSLPARLDLLFQFAHVFDIRA